ncbi:MAG: sulfotransferase family protein [Myxococcota bacterium]
MARSRPVFIAGLARSGTYALRAALLRHSAFRAREPRMQETRIFEHPEWIVECFERKRARRFYHYMLGDDERARAMLAMHEAIRPAFAPAREWLAARTRDPALAWRLRGWHHRVRSYFRFALDARGARRILEKTPNHVHHLPELFATFPRACVILSKRHPVDAYASLRRRLERDSGRGRPEGKLRWLRISPRGFAGRYRDVLRDERRARKRWPDRTFSLRYEDTTRDPEGTLRAVCDFIGEPFEPPILGRGEALLDAHGAPTKASPLTENRSVWQDWVEASEAELLESKLAGPMQRLGYRPIAGEPPDAERVVPAGSAAAD